jgi:8-oxo-dGTP pyrophosphatase MutT (NUDIX family)
VESLLICGRLQGSAHAGFQDSPNRVCSACELASGSLAAHMNHNRRPVLKLGVVDFGVESDASGAIPLLTQYRHAVVGWLKEIPAGCINSGETPRECAERELREEAGLVARRWDQLGAIVTIPSFCDERVNLFLARELTEAERELDHDEVINVERVQLDEALAMIGRGEIFDAKTIAALHLAREFLRADR